MSRKNRKRAAPVLLTPTALAEQAARCVRLRHAREQAGQDDDPARVEAAGRTFAKAHSVLDAMCTAALAQGADEVLDGALDRAARAEGGQVLMTLVTSIEELCTNFVDAGGGPTRTLCALPVVVPADRVPVVLPEAVVEALELAFVAGQPGGTVAVVNRQLVPGAFLESLDHSLVYGLGAAAAARPMAELRTQVPGLMPELPEVAFQAGARAGEPGDPADAALFHALAMIEGPAGFVDEDDPRGVPESVRRDVADALGAPDLRFGMPEPIYAALDAGPALLLAAQAREAFAADLAERRLPATEAGRALAVTLHGRHATAGADRRFLPKELRVSLLDAAGHLLAGHALDAEAVDISDFFLDRLKRHLADGLDIRTVHDPEGVFDDQEADRYWTPSGWQALAG